MTSAPLNGKAQRLRDRFPESPAHIRWNPKTRDWQTLDAALDDATLKSHAAGRVVVGTYPAVNGVASAGLLDIDLHLKDRDPTPDEVARVEEYAIKKHTGLTGQGIDAVLLRHHPYGSYHIEFFTKPLAADRLGRWLAWFAADAGEVHVDTFPSTSGAGNAVRLPGRHHRRPEYWTEVRLKDGTWGAWPACVAELLALRENPASAFPDPGKPKNGCIPPAPPDPPTESRKCAVDAVAAVWPQVGGRRNAGLALAGGLLRAGFAVKWVEDFLRAVATAAKDDEVEKRVRCVTDTHQKLTDGEEVTGWPSLAKELRGDGDTTVRTVREVLGLRTDADVVSGGSVNSVTGWPDPVPLSVPPDVPDYPVCVLPGWLREWSGAVATELQVPVDLPACIAMGLVGAGIGRKVVVRPRDGFVEPTNVYVMCSLQPGERKTQTLKKGMGPVLELERELVEAAKPIILEMESEYRIAEKLVKNLEEKIAKPGCPDKEVLHEELKTARADLLKIEVPAKPLLYSEDDTPESLKKELVQQGGRLMVASTEAKCLENITLYSDRPNFDVYLKGHAGDEIKSGRIGRGRDSVAEPALSCVLSPQPEVLRGLAENEVLSGRGFLARWFYSLPRSNVGNRQVGAPAVPPAVQARYHRLLKSVWQSGYAEGDAASGRPHVLPFDAEAIAEFEAFENWLEPQLATGQSLARLAGWGNKLNGACARLAAALHVAEHLETSAGTDWTGSIGVESVRGAVCLCRDYFIPHAIAAFGLMGTNPVVRNARKLWVWIRSGAHTTFKVRDAFRGCQSQFDTVDDIQPALDLLARHYLIRPQGAQPRSGPGRPATPVYDVNPSAGPEVLHEEVL